MFALACFFQQVNRAPPHHVHAVVDEVLERLHQPHLFRLAIHHGQENHAEAFLHLRVLEQLVQDDLRLGAALQLHHNAHAVAARFVAHVGDIVDDLVIYQLRNALHDLGFVHLVGNFPHDDRLASLVQVFNRGFGAHHKLAPAMRIGSFNPAAPVDVRSGGEVRAFHDLENFFERRGRSVHQCDGRFNDFREVVGRNVCRHAHGNAVRSIHQQIRNPRRKDRRLDCRFVIVRREVHRLFVDVLHQRAGDPLQAAFRITHRRRRVVVHRSKISLPVNQRIAQRKILRHAHQRVINRRVAVRMVEAHGLSHYLGALGVLLVVLQAHLLHGVEHTPMHRL